MMTYDVLLFQRNQKYIARVRQWPEVMVEGDTEAGVLAQVEADLQDLLNHVRIVQVDVDIDPQTHPWAQWAGIFEEDEDWDAFQADIASYRQAIDNAEMTT